MSTGTPTLDGTRRAVAAVFAVSGFTFASWIARLPDIRDDLGLTPGQVGLLLLCMSSGSVAALPMSGVVITRLGPARTVLAGMSCSGTGLTLMALGLSIDSVVLVGGALLLNGVGYSIWDVAMNVEAADVERRLARPIMPRFHAGFSIGTVLGAATSAVCTRLEVSLPLQLVVTVVLAVAVVVAATRLFQPPLAEDHAGSEESVWRAWREPRTLAVGVVVLVFALCEGIANDWLALALVDGYDAEPAVGAAAFAAFVAAMTLGRVVGGGLTARFGRVTTLRATAVLVVLGSATVVLSPGTAGAFAGALVWGLGASLGFPLGMTAAGEDPARAAARLSVVSSIGYAAFLGGPPLLGLIADHVGVRDALLVAAVAAAVGLVAAPAVRASEPAPAPR